MTGRGFSPRPRPGLSPGRGPSPSLGPSSHTHAQPQSQSQSHGEQSLQPTRRLVPPPQHAPPPHSAPNDIAQPLRRRRSAPRSDLRQGARCPHDHRHPARRRRIRAPRQHRRSRSAARFRGAAGCRPKVRRRPNLAGERPVRSRSPPAVPQRSNPGRPDSGRCRDVTVIAWEPGDKRQVFRRGFGDRDGVTGYACAVSHRPRAGPLLYRRHVPTPARRGPTRKHPLPDARLSRPKTTLFGSGATEPPLIIRDHPARSVKKPCLIRRRIDCIFAS
jgi:hypothetical protein